MGLYASANKPAPALQEILQNPRAYANQRVRLYVETLVDSVTSDGFLLRQGSATIRVRGSAVEVRRGEFVSIVGTFRPQMFVELEEIYVARNRRVKMAVSVAGVAFVLLLMPGFLRWRHARLELTSDA